MKKISKIAQIFGLLLIAVSFYFFGYLIGHKNFVFEKDYKPKLVNLELKKPPEVDFGIFWQAYDTITQKYVGKYSVQKLVYGAIKGMVESLDDPYSVFIEPNGNKMFLDDLSGEIEGIGAEISQQDKQLIVVAPLEDSPAQKAGLKPKDQILEIDGQDTSEMTLEQAIQKIRGKAGTSVTLLISRTDFPSPKEFKITREKITVASVKWEMKGDIGYIQITQFGQDTSTLAQKAASELKSKNPKAIILDLRNNPGGYLDAAVDVGSLFVPPGSVIVKEEYKDGHKEELKTTLEGILKDYKVVVLVNEGSASAAEIVAGALQDLRGATLIGKKTFGKGSVQELENLASQAILRLTIARWLTPKDRTIDKEGLQVDYEVNETDQDRERGLDPQLDKALELVR